jgi:hypothetical protein
MPRKAAGSDQTGIPPEPWWQRATTGRTLAVVILFSLALFVLMVGFEFVSTRYRLVAMMVGVDAGVAALCGAFLLLIVRNAQARHWQLMQQLEMIADLNHHIRNALEDIQLSAHSTRNQDLIQDIQAAVSRIEWALREVLPQPERKP